VVDNSLNQSNNVLNQSTASIYSSFDELAKDPKTAEKAAIWKPKAEKARDLAKRASDLIDKYKRELMKEAEYDPTSEDPKGQDNLDAATRLFDTRGEGKNLYAALESFKKDILAIDPEISKDLAAKLPLNLEAPKSASGNKPTGDKIKDWTNAYFHMSPTVAALTMLSKFQNDVKNAENQVATYCINRVGSVKIVLDKFKPLIGTSSTYLMPGEEMVVTAGLGAFNASVKPTVSIDGRAITVDDNGVAVSKFNVGGTGTRPINVVVKYIDPNTGEEKTVSESIEYTVGAPSGVAVSADKMNVMYIGVDNPVTITAGAGSEKVSATFSGGALTKVGGNKYIAKPSAGSNGEQSVNVMVEGKSVGKVVFRVKQLPNPAAYVGNLKVGSVPAQSFKNMGGVVAKLEDSEFDAPFQVIGYTIGAQSPDIPFYSPINNEGPRWSGNAAALVTKLKPGALVVITDIQVKGPDGKLRTLPGSLSYSLK
jgi:gliding motility-associated protein GldM